MRSSQNVQDQIRERLTLSDIIGRSVKLKRAGKEYMGLCPFHGEKSPSFTVNNQKGFFHCFGCGAHGDVFGFLMQDENLSFPEALRKAADMAGVRIEESYRPQTPESSAQMERQEKLFQIIRRAADYYADCLHKPLGTPAKKYIQSRNLTEETVRAFGLGYAPQGWETLKKYLQEQGFSLEDILAVGLLSQRETKEETYDKFRHRLMFPITNKKGQFIGFGGRSLSEDQEPKYLNSPETPLFHKGEILYNYHQAAKSRARDLPLLVVEGYMDVIKLVQAGYPRVVAPLGTALTEAQMYLCWRLDSNPVIVMDGDAAGIRAQKRVIERALPMISPEKTFSFLTLPEGQDPDGFVDARGMASFKELLSHKATLADQLWHLFYVSEPSETPEQKSKNEKVLFGNINAIKDPTLKNHYYREMRQRLTQLFQLKKTSPSFRPGAHNSFGKKSFSSPLMKDLPVKLFLLLTLKVPLILEEFEEEFASVKLPQPYEDVQSSCLAYFAENPPQHGEDWILPLKEKGHAQVLSYITEDFMRSHVPALLRETSVEDLRQLWKKSYEDLVQKEHKDLVQEAKEAFEKNPTEENWEHYSNLLKRSV